jgi:diguanylate cyclase (GGDEF)-like protein
MHQPKAAEAVAEGNLHGLAQAIGQIGSYVEDLRERMRLLEAVIENFPGGISLFDRDLQLVLCNSNQKRLLDYPDELFANGNPTLEDLFRFNAVRGEYGPGDIEEQVARRLALVRKRTPHVFERTRPNGTVVEVRGVPIEGGGFVTTYFDVTEQRRNQAMIAHMAHHDALTDLPNRMLFSDRLQSAIALAKRAGLMAVHYLDVDNFKPVNDNLGHQAGDQLLVGVAGRLRSIVRENDTVARLGGDEFAIVQTGIREVSDAAVLARRVLTEFSSPFNLSGTDVNVGVSIGIAFSPKDGISTDDILVKADSALYKSKSSGRGRFSFYGAA